jgi:hypothetical protein
MPMIDPVLRVQASLTQRDHVLLGWLADHGVLTTFQIATALFPSLDYAQDRLRKLFLLNVVDRFRPNRPDGGTYPYHYVLAQLGVEVVVAQRGEEPPRRGQAKQRRQHLTSRANLSHLLGINGFFTDLAAHARTHSGAELERWWPAARCQQPGAFADDSNATDPLLWSYRPRSRPDAHGIWTENGLTVPFFLEYDTGTERPMSRLVDKLDGYAALAKVYQRVWPVLFSLHSSVRQRHLHRDLAEDGVRYPVATVARDNPAHTNTGQAGAVWWLHRHEGPPLRLAELAFTVVDRSTRQAIRPPGAGR